MKDFAPYKRRVFYYETDQMGVVHHSNYIRWFEEAREDMMRRSGIDYGEIEARGVMMPVKHVDCDYKSGAKYGESVEIFAFPRYFNGVRLRFAYEIRAADGTLLVTGQSEHCFIDALSRKPLNLKKRMPECCEILSRLTEIYAEGQFL